MEFRLLGTVSVDTRTGPLPLGPAKRRSLLAALLLSANTPVPVARLTDSLWGEDPLRAPVASSRGTSHASAPS